MASVLPKNLALIVQRLANFHRTSIRVRAQSNDTVNSGSTVVFRLPTNTLVDLHNIQLTGKCYLSGQAAVLGLPTSMHGCIERLDVVVNGQVISGNNADYGGLHALFSHHVAGTSNQTVGQFLKSGSSPMDPTLLAAANTAPALISTVQVGGTAGRIETVSTTGYQWPFVISGFLGFLSGQYVRFIDTAVLGPVEIRIRLASKGVCFGAADAATRGVMDYSFNSMYMYLDTISFTDDFYRAILAKRLLDGGLISIPYPNYFSFQKGINTSADTHTFNLATQSLDYLFTSFRALDNVNQTYKRWSANALNTYYYHFLSASSTSGVANSGVAAPTNYQFLVNNQMFPTWPASVDDAYILTRAALDLAGDYTDTGTCTTMEQYRNGRFLFAQCFKHQAEMDKVISGMDTRGASSNMQFTVNGINALPVNTDFGTSSNTSNYQNIIWAACTSSLEISAGQNVVVIF